MTALAYDDFLQAKVRFDEAVGFDVADSDIHPIMLDHQRLLVRWGVSRGRGAFFAAFGLGKTLIQLETLRLILACSGLARALVVVPLAVRQEMRRDAALIGLDVTFIRSNDEIDGPGIYLTNYESVRLGKVDVTRFDAVSLDEAAVLRSLSSKQTQALLTQIRDVPYRFLATATPSPNRYIELVNYADWLGVMDRGQALTRFFQRDTTHAGNLTLHPHKAEEFFLWLSTWSIFLQKPSDIGCSDDGYNLPPIEVVWHEVAVDHSEHISTDRDGQARMFRGAELGVSDAAREKRMTLGSRVSKAAEIVNADPEDHFILWHHLEIERKALEDAFPVVEYSAWVEFRDGHPKALELFDRHYSAKPVVGVDRKLFVGPGQKLVLLTRDETAMFAWRKFIDDSGQTGVCCAVFRNEGPELSSTLIREAMAIAWLRWPGERLYTFVDAKKITSTNPGYCFKQAGWRDVGATKGGLRILEYLCDEGWTRPVVRPIAALSSVFGALDLDEQERRVIAFADGEARLLATKPSINGAGCNLQRHCHRAIYVGVDFDFHLFIQSVHRIQRFQQTHPVRIDIIYAESEREVVRTLRRKWAEHEELTTNMSNLIKEHGLSRDAIDKALTRSIGVDRQVAAGDGWTAVLNDCVDETTNHMADNSVDEVVTSIPFGNQYEYSASVNDFGHTDNNDHFWQQMDYITPQLLRILKPGRIYCCHVKDRMLYGNMTGAGCQTSSPFHAEAILHGMEHGFLYLGMITIVTDVVAENNQTYRLTQKEMRKDGTKMGVGTPEYVLLFRKQQTDTANEYADEPVTHPDKTKYSLARWQTDAHGFWRSSGNRHLTPTELAALPPDQLYRLWRDYSTEATYDYEQHIDIGESLEHRDPPALPSTFMLLAPPSHHPDVWTDVDRLHTLNGEQTRRGLQNHICPLQFDIVDRLINRYSNPGDLIFDPFGGLSTVAVRALELGRRGYTVELNPMSWRDGVKYCEMTARKVSAPTLFDLDALDQAGAA